MTGPLSRFLTPSQGTPVPTYQGQTPDAPVSTGDVVNASALLAHQDQIGSQGTEEYDAYKPIVAQLDAMDDRPVLTRLLQGPRYMNAAAAFNPVDTDAVWSEIARQRAADPDFMKDVKATNAGEFSSLVQSQQLQQRQAAQGVLSRKSGVVQDVASFGTGVAAGFTDPINLGAMIATGGTGAVRTLVGGMAREALVNGAITAAQEPFTIGNRSRFGEDTTAGDVVTDIAEGAAGGAVFHGGLHAVGAGAARVMATPAGRAVADAAGNAVDAVGRAAASVALRFADLAGANDNDVAAALRKAVPADNRTPDQQAALHVVDRQSDIDATNPYQANAAGQQAHADNLGSAISDLLSRGDPTGVPAVPRETVPSAGAPVDLSPDRVIRFVMGDLEGGARVVHYGDVDGGTTKFGIAAKANPGVDVANLTADSAAQIARSKYWLPEYDHADPRTAAVAFDAGYIAGPDVGRRILRESGGDPERAIELYRGYLDHLADTNPAKAKYRDGWNNRVDKLQRFVGGSEDRATLRPDGFPDGDALDLAQHDIDQADMDQQMLDQEGRLANGPEPIAPSPDASLPPIMEGSALTSDASLEPEPRSTEPGSSEAISAQPMAAPRPPSIVQPDAPVTIRPETRVAVRDYASDRSNSLVPDKVAAALGIEPAEARGALEMLAARSDGTILQRANGRFVRRAVRRAPVDLNRFLSDMGGIRDNEGHDLVGGRELQKFVPASGMLIRSDGMPLDRAREAAAEAGYFHQHGTPDEAIAHTTTADFLDLLEHAHSNRHYALADLGEADRLANLKANADQVREIGDVVDARLQEQGFEFDRGQRRRAAELVQQQGLTHEEAIIRTINEEITDLLDESHVEAENDQYERAAHDAAQATSVGDRRGSVRDDGSGLDAGDPGESEARVKELRGADSGGNAASDEREADGLAGPPPLHDPNIERFSDPAGEGTRAVVASIEHDVRALVANTPAREVNAQSLGPIYLAPKGEPGFHLEDSHGDGHMLYSVFRDEAGSPKGVLAFPATDEARAQQREFGTEGVTVYVDPAYRRQGIATKLYDQAQSAGHDINSLSGEHDLTPNGAAFASARRDLLTERGKLDRGAEVDPAIAERQRQQAQLQADGPMRARSDQDSTIGSPLFDAVDQHQFRLDDEGGERAAADILKEIDGDEAAIKAAKDCL